MLKSFWNTPKTLSQCNDSCYEEHPCCGDSTQKVMSYSHGTSPIWYLKLWLERNFLFMMLISLFLYILLKFSSTQILASCQTSYLKTTAILHPPYHDNSTCNMSYPIPTWKAKNLHWWVGVVTKLCASVWNVSDASRELNQRYRIYHWSWG